MKITKGKYKENEINEIHLDLVIGDWSPRWELRQYEISKKWIVVKHDDNHCDSDLIIVEISANQAFQLIKTIGLIKITSKLFNGFYWKRKADVFFLKNWNSDQKKAEIENDKVRYRGKMGINSVGVSHCKTLLELKGDTVSLYAKKIILAFEKKIIELQV